MASWTTTLQHGLLICIPFSIFVIISFRLKPRLWLHSLPADIRDKVEQKSRNEIRLTRYVLLPSFLLILPGLSTASTVYLIHTSEIDSFAGVLTHLYSLWIIVHLWDLIVIDFGWMLFIDPASPPIKGTEHAKGWRDASFHTRSLLTAIPMSAVFVLPVSGLLWWIFLSGSNIV